MKYIVSCIIFCLFLGCNELDPKDEKEVREFVTQWNDAHTQLKSPYLERDYMDVVNYYGKERTRNQVQNDKNLLFEQFPDYTQHILDDQLEITKEEGSYLVTFIKQVSYNDLKADYPSYISLMNRNGTFKILREGVAEIAQGLDAPIFPKARETSATIANTRQLFGDFNGDGLSDYATVISPSIRVEGADIETGDVNCDGECISVINFSNQRLQPITIIDAYQSDLENLKDLNSDGADEIGFWNIKPFSKSLHVFDPTDGQLLCEPIFINTKVHKSLDLIDVFKKTGPNKITVTNSILKDGKWILKSEVISLK